MEVGWGEEILRHSHILLALTSAKEMDEEPLSKQHLPTAQHATPTTICGPHGALQLLKFPTIGQPDAGGEVLLEALHILCKAKLS